MKLKKVIIFGLLAAVAMGTVAYGMMRPKTVPAAVIAAKDVRLFFSEEGFVKDENTINVFSLHAGEVVALHVQENQWINQGEVICEIDSTSLVHELETAKTSIRGFESQISDLALKEMQMRDELTVSRSRLRGEYESLIAEENNASQTYLNTAVSKDEQIRLQEIVIEQNRIDLKNAQDELRTSEVLFQGGAMTKSTLDSRKAAVENFENTLNQGLQQLEVIRNSNDALSKEAYFQSMRNTLLAQISAIDRQLGNSYNDAMQDYYQTQIEGVQAKIRLLEKQIEDCVVKAPASGTLAELHIDKSNVAALDAPVAVISTGFDNLVEVFVPTAEIGKVQLGDRVDLELKSASGIVYQGVVTEIEDKAVVTVSSLGIEKRKVKVTIQPLPEYAEHFKAGYDLNASFTTYRGENKLTVPRTAVVRNGDQFSVWVIEGGKTTLRPIAIEQELKVEYVVQSGLAAGDVVVKDATAAGLGEGAQFTGVF